MEQCDIQSPSPREPDIQFPENLLVHLETPQQHLKRFKAELVPLESGPYSDIYITLSKALHHGSNTYSILSTADQDIVHEALRQRCHSSSQLRSHKYVLLCNNSRGIRLPPGLTLQDFLPSRPRSNSTPKRRAVAIDLASHPAPCGKPSLAGTALRADALLGPSYGSLCVAHTRIVDTSLQTAEAVFRGVELFRRVWALKDLMKELVKVHIQSHGRQGHDCVEDTLATRELALWCLQNPRKLEAWG
ncbi:hypothetical protein OOU_Y34scaffold00268g5 [Pyricularia oryzae Y34]|uniref:Exonuclease domain-containing protein n=1 Tax=Pyricularia oryzae (strain Y34) TaxID=1143189 RepID=A0AA97P3Z4_PYRO3|nr:hypothetical protein OOU_Y34scaffold00268g5 [Pyricularia oryzae Y34]